MTRIVALDGKYFSAGGTTNNVFAAGSGSVAMPESREKDGKTCWRVEMQRLSSGKSIVVSGLESEGVSSATVDAQGSAFVYLPDGEYSFTADAWPWSAAVAGAPAVAWRITGVAVDGVDAGRLAGDGWTFDPASSKLAVTAGCVLSGTNTQGKVRCVVDTQETVTMSNLVLKATGTRQTPFAIVSNTAATVWFTGTNEFASGRYCAAIEVPYETKLAIGGDGWLYATGGACNDYWGCAGIGASDNTQWPGNGDIAVTGGNIVATSGAQGTVPGILYPTVSGGSINVGRSSRWNYIISLSAYTPDGADANCLVVEGLEPWSHPVVEGLPDYYNTDGIQADGDGRIYLYLKAWDYTDASDKGRIRFTVNGERMTALVRSSGAASVAEKMPALVSIEVESITVENGKAVAVLAVDTPEWLEMFYWDVKVRASQTLPLPGSDDAVLPSSAFTVEKLGGGRARFTIPLSPGAASFFYRFFAAP